MRNDESILQLALEASRLGVWDYDLREDHYFGDERCRRIYGVPGKESLSAAKVLELIHPEDRDRVEEAALAARDPGSDGYYEAEYRIFRPDGSMRWVVARGQAFFAGEGEERHPVRFSGVVMDVTERRAIEQALHDREQSLDLALTSAQGGYWNQTMDPHRPLEMPDEIYISPSLKAVVGFSDQEMPNSVAAWHGRIHPDDREVIRRASLDHLEGRTFEYQVEYRFRCQDESWRWLFSRGRVIRDSRGRPVRWTGVDIEITRRKKMEEELVRAKEAAEAGNRAKDTFLLTMSHELRTPLAINMGMLELAGTYGNCDEETKKYLETANDSAEALLHLIENLLDFRSLQNKTLALREETIDLEECCSEALDLLCPAARRKGLDCTLHVDSRLPRKIIGDCERLHQVLLNLVGNAVKFTEQGAVEIVIRKGRETSDDRVNVAFEIRDTGIGIPADRLPDLLQPFSQADSSLTRRFGGAGLGLAISAGIIEKMGGKLELRGREEGGSLVSFELPLVTVAEQDQRTTAGAKEPSGIQHGHILLVEDDPLMANLLELMLTRGGYWVSMAENGQKALERMEREVFDLILMDLKMPVMDGFEATRSIRSREKWRDIPIIALTAHARPEDRSRCLAVGMNDFLAKPVGMEMLHSTIQKHINH